MVWYGWVGLGVLAVSQALLPLRWEPHARWFTPIMWTAYVLVADALVLRRRGASLIRDHPREAAFMATVSIPLWCVFELYNWRLRNWDYFGVPEPAWLAALGYGQLDLRDDERYGYNERDARSNRLVFLRSTETGAPLREEDFPGVCLEGGTRCQTR